MSSNQVEEDKKKHPWTLNPKEYMQKLLNGM